MDTIGFSLKRADQRMLAFQRALLEPLEPLGLTPARYVVLVFIARSPWKLGLADRYCYQSSIWRGLGVSPVTICKMLARMEELDLVRRVHKFDQNDQRQVAVFLTKKAHALLRIVDRAFIRPGVLYIATHTIFGRDQGRVGGLCYLLDKLRR